MTEGIFKNNPSTIPDNLRTLKERKHADLYNMFSGYCRGAPMCAPENRLAVDILIYLNDGTRVGFFITFL